MIARETHYDVLWGTRIFAVERDGASIGSITGVFHNMFFVNGTESDTRYWSLDDAVASFG